MSPYLLATSNILDCTYINIVLHLCINELSLILPSNILSPLSFLWHKYLTVYFNSARVGTSWTHVESLMWYKSWRVSCWVVRELTRPGHVWRVSCGTRVGTSWTRVKSLMWYESWHVLESLVLGGARVCMSWTCVKHLMLCDARVCTSWTCVEFLV